MDSYRSSRKKEGVSLTKESSVLLSKKEVRPVQRCNAVEVEGMVVMQKTQGRWRNCAVYGW